MLEAFKIKPFDLEPVYAAWTGPHFLGDPKKDPPVDDWLQEIKDGCIKQNVPKEYWHTCAQHFLGDKAKARLTELKKVMAQVHGGHYRWNWKKFKVAMRNMSWDIDTSETETVKLPKGPFWWLPKSPKAEREDDEWLVCDEPQENERPSFGRSNTIMRLLSKESAPTKEPAPEVERPAVGRAATNSFWPVRKDSKEITAIASVPRPAHRKAKSDGSILSSREVSKALPAIPDGESTVRAPAWLLNAATALDFLQGEHPRVMTTLSAVLIVVGTIPALPAISAGAGGALLASSTAHAVGAIAVSIGTWMKTQQEIKGQQDTHAK